MYIYTNKRSPGERNTAQTALPRWSPLSNKFSTMVQNFVPVVDLRYYSRQTLYGH